MLSKLVKWSGSYVSRRLTKLPVARLSNQPQISTLKPQQLLKPFAFTIAFCGSSFAVATVWEYENRKIDVNKYNMLPTGVFRANKNKSQQGDQLFPMAKQWWDSQTDGFKVFLSIAFLNGLVFLGWRVPRLYPFMNKYFISSIESKSIRVLPMVLSNFSHYSPFHIGLNMMVLYSFSDLGVHLFGKENFMALYFSSGVVSTFASYAYKVATHSLAPSLGASGAILGILASACIERPDIKLMIIFLPFFTFSSATALKGLILLDSLGLVLRWGFFDHAAHLGGTLFGVFYSFELKEYMSKHRATVINHWNDLKQKF